MSMFDLTGKVAIVTGGNGGIGLGIAEGLAECGASVLLTGRNAKKGEAAARKIGAKAAFEVADVARQADCARLVQVAVAKFGRLDILVNNAGISIRKTPQDFTEADWHRVIDTNLSGTFFLCQAAYPEFRRVGGGKIINIASVNAILGAPHNVPYAASKGGVAAMTRGLATAWAGDNIQVNAILPGWVETEMTDSAKAHIPGLTEYVVARTPAGRWGKPRDLAGLAVFLAGPSSDWVTGTSMLCDGGYSIRA
ncbi:MAG: glucose 1-dehydrogenase [Alphaproteobacteria bacterium]|nr:glucose 1-dehydrogenase [Alphaproteobacteria bacterium]